MKKLLLCATLPFIYNRYFILLLLVLCFFYKVLFGGNMVYISFFYLISICLFTTFNLRTKVFNFINYLFKIEYVVVFLYTDNTDDFFDFEIFLNKYSVFVSFMGSAESTSFIVEQECNIKIKIDRFEIKREAYGLYLLK